ncbi:PREDICTED: Holliday junction recognition protein isoform X1 [Propithecus coquereli]|uniref:Holliday junction recognition protein isoform X1 n=1 Tax=Propithecus coquereli TaxID=379532 RepID=UPI00063F99A5|nr:PREDICTED: Holliday junction recognition protein isoform X1 [Propithecus coquereli]
MAGEVSGEDALLLQKLKDSRRRFQRRMQRLIEKYNRPFEDAPLVQMSTLTYETPQGLRIWGGGLIKERNKGQIQDSPVKPVDRINGPVRAAVRGPELPEQGTQVLGADAEGSEVDATLDQEDPAAWAVMPAVPQSPLKNELRRKYLTQVDILLQDSGCFECVDDGHTCGKDRLVALLPSLASAAMPAPGYCGGVSGKSPGDPAKPASSPRQWDPPRPCSTDMAIVPRNDTLSLTRTSSSSFLSSRSFVDDDICDVTISDLYEGMVHSMSRLLSTKPSSIISTKTSIMQNWNSRRRHRCKSRMNKTYCKGGRHSQRLSKERFLPSSEPVQERGMLRDCKNLLDVSYRKTGLKLKKAVLEVKPQIHKSDLSWKELKVTPQKYSSLTYLDPNGTHSPDQENRLMTLKWLISPVKRVTGPRILPGHGGNHHREIEIRFDELYREYCLTPRKQSRLTGPPNSWAVDVYKGGPTSPGGRQGLETHRLSFPFKKAKAKRLNEAFDAVGRRPTEVSGCLPRGGSSWSLSNTSPTPSPGPSQQMPDLHFQGNSSGMFRKSVWPSKAVSVPRIGPLGCGRNRYDEIKEQFDKLHQKYCPKLPVQAKAPLGIGASLDKASVEVQDQTEDLGTSNPDSRFQGSPKLSLSSSPTKSLLGSTAIVAHPSACISCATGRDLQSPAKRCRLSDPWGCGHHIGSRDSSGCVGRAALGPGEQGSSSQPDSEEKVRFCLLHVEFSE